MFLAQESLPPETRVRGPSFALDGETHLEYADGVESGSPCPPNAAVVRLRFDHAARLLCAPCAAIILDIVLISIPALLVYMLSRELRLEKGGRCFSGESPPMPWIVIVVLYLRCTVGGSPDRAML